MHISQYPKKTFEKYSESLKNDRSKTTLKKITKMCGCLEAKYKEMTGGLRF